MKLERFLFSIFIFSLPFQTRIILWQFTQPFNEWTAAFLWGSDVLFALLLVFSFQFSIFKKNLLPVLFLAVVAISISNAIISEVAWYRWAKLVEYVFVFWYMSRRALRVISLDGIARIIIASVAFQAVIGIVQYLAQHSIGLKIFGESVLNPVASGVAVVVADGERYLRAYGTFPHPNVLALWLVIGIWAFWYISNIKPQKSKVFYFMYALILIALVLTFSRTVIALWSVSSIFLLRKQYFRLAMVTISIIAIISILVLPQIISRVRISSDDEAFVQRVFFNEQALAGTRDHLAIGNGIGQFVPILMRDLHFYSRSIYQPAHNVYLLILYETGIVGLLIFLFFIARLFWKIRQKHFAVAILGTFCAVALFDHFPWTLQQGGLMFWGMLGILDARYEY